MKLIAVTVNFKDVSERIFHVDHSIGLFTRIIKSRFSHTFFSSCGDNFFSQTFYIWILNTEVACRIVASIWCATTVGIATAAVENERR
jgi:hypothetical protein